MTPDQEKPIQQEVLTSETLPPPIVDEQPHEFTDKPGPETEGIDLRLSQLMPVMVAGLFFGDGGKKPDGTELTNQERAAAFCKQTTMILEVIGFDDALSDVIPGVADNVNPLYVVAGGVAAMLGIAFMMRPPKKPKVKNENQPQEKPRRDTE